ncbi:MAG: ATP-binding protein [Dehalococcoidia bacterium]
MVTAKQDLSQKDFHRLEALRAMVEPVLDQFRAEYRIERAFVVLVDPSSAVIRDIQGLTPPSPLLDAFGVPPRAPDLFLQALREKRAKYVRDSAREPGLTALAKAACAQARMSSFCVVPLLPTSSVLVVSRVGRPKQPADHPVDEVFGVAGQLVALLWEHVRTQEWEDANNADLAQRDWLRWMLNAVPDPVVLSDEQNNILYENEHASRLFQASLDDSPGKRRAVELNNFLLSTALSSFVLDQGASLGREFSAVDPIEGSELLFEVICQTIENPTTGEHNLVSVLRNVTDLHRAIEELRNSLRELQQVNSDLRYERDRLNLVLENVVDPIVVTNAANEVVLVNASAKQLLQSLDEHRPARRQSTAYYTNDAKFMAFLLDLQLSPDGMRRRELQFIDPATEEEIAVRITATKVNNPLGQLGATVSVLHDLTEVRELERRRLEHQLFESEKLAAMGRLAASVAHEINNPLESIKNALHLLQDDVPEAAANRKFLDIATKETERVSRIIRQMLGFYRGGANKAPVHINGLIEEAVALLQRQFTFRGITVQPQLASDLPAIIASNDQLKQVFLNLFLNAQEVMEDGGRLHITTRMAQDKEADTFRREHVLIKVRDTGGGIAAEHLDHIFDPFFSTKQERGGTGLGLWVCHDIIKHHGGEIRVHSRLGQGTAFIIALPLSVDAPFLPIPIPADEGQG